MVGELLALLVLLLALAWALLARHYSSYRRRGVPSLSPVFFLGDTKNSILGYKSMSSDIADLYNRLKPNRYGVVYQGLVPSWLLLDPELIRQVTVKDFSYFSDRGIALDEESEPMDANLFFLGGTKWRALRNRLSPTFTSGRIKEMTPQVECCLQELQDTLSKKSEVEIKELTSMFTMNVIGSVAFGFDPASFKDPNNIFYKMGFKIFEPSIRFLLATSIRFGLPRLYLALGMKFWPKDVTSYFLGLIQRTLDGRESTGRTRKDFVQLLLQLRQKGKIETRPEELDSEDVEEERRITKLAANTTIELTEPLLAAQAFVFFLAGYETTSMSISFTLYHLAKWPSFQERARQEVRRLKEEFGGELPYDALVKMEFLEACMWEAMRIHPSVGMMFRVCNKDYELAEGVTIRKGERILISIQGVHSDPQIYPEPQEYRPERFLGEGHPSLRTPCTFLPFGEGPRMCIGKRFAIMEMKKALADILDRYSFSLSPRTKEPIQMDPRVIINTPAGGIWLNVKSLES